MNLKRAIWVAVLLYAVIFLVGLVILFALGFSDSANIIANLITLIFLAGLTWFAAVFYFRGKKVKKNFKEGFWLGVTFVIVGFILDFVILLPFISTGLFIEKIKEYYLSPLFFIGLVIILLVSSLAGKLKT